LPGAEDRHPVGDLGPGGQHEPLRECVRPRTAGRDLRGLDACGAEDRVERAGELPGPVADQEAEAGGILTEIHQEITGLLGGPRPIGMRGDPQDVHVPALNLDDE
jgi:hypothetical protein